MSFRGWRSRCASSRCSSSLIEDEAGHRNLTCQKLLQTFIERYAGFGDFVGNYVYANGSLTPLGQTYSQTK
jgi:hypothetical protein